MFLRVMLIAAGVLVGVGSSEIGLRLYFHEHEANRNYWGRYAFVEDDILPYRHAAATSATAGREGSFGPHLITTNALGFRDDRVPTDTVTAPRIVVAGASFMFGLGIENDEDLFHVQLEHSLRRRPDCPKDVEVFNVAQTGFKLSEVCTLVERETGRFRPDMVLVVLHENNRRLARGKQVDMFDGYRLGRGRLLAGTWADYLRTRSYVWMRLPSRNMLMPDAGRDGTLSHARRLWRWCRGTESSSSVDYALTGRLLTDLQGKLLAQGSDLICLVVYPLAPLSAAFGDALRRMGLTVIDIEPEPEWRLPFEGHWNAYGHRMAAEYVADRIPCSSLAPGSPVDSQ